MNEASMELQNVRKSCKAICVVTNIVKIMLCVFAVLCLVTGIALFIGKDEVNKQLVNFGDGFDMGSFTLEMGRLGNGLAGEIALNEIDPEDRATMLGFFCIVGAVLLGIGFVLFHIMGSIFKSIRESDSPFTEAISKKLKISFIIVTAILLLFVGVFECALTALVFWCIYTIFRYGYVLQKQSDETL